MKLYTIIAIVCIVSFSMCLSAFIWELLSGFQFLFYTEILIRVGLIWTFFFEAIFSLMMIVKEME